MIGLRNFSPRGRTCGGSDIVQECCYPAQWCATAGSHFASFAVSDIMEMLGTVWLVAIAILLVRPHHGKECESRFSCCRAVVPCKGKSTSVLLATSPAARAT